MMNSNLYVSPKDPASNKKNLLPIIIAVLLLIIAVVLIISLIRNSSSTPNTKTDNVITSVITPTTTSVATTVPTDTIAIINTSTPIPTPSGPTPTGTPIKVYFYKSPIKPSQSTDEVYDFLRYTADSNVVGFGVDQIFKGPNTEEKAAGYILPFTLSGSSACGGSTYKYNYSSSFVKLTVCKDINPIAESGDGGGSAGSSLRAMARVLKVLTSTLKIGSITKVEVYDKNNVCYAPDTGLNGCTP